MKWRWIWALLLICMQGEHEAISQLDAKRQDMEHLTTFLKKWQLDGWRVIVDANVNLADAQELISTATTQATSIRTQRHICHISGRTIIVSQVMEDMPLLPLTFPITLGSRAEGMLLTLLLISGLSHEQIARLLTRVVWVDELSSFVRHCLNEHRGGTLRRGGILRKSSSNIAGSDAKLKLAIALRIVPYIRIRGERGKFEGWLRNLNALQPPSHINAPMVLSAKRRRPTIGHYPNWLAKLMSGFVSIQEPVIVSIEECLRNIKNTLGIKISADPRVYKHRVVLSGGRYPVIELLEGICLCGHASLRVVGDILHLGIFHRRVPNQKVKAQTMAKMVGRLICETVEKGFVRASNLAPELPFDVMEILREGSIEKHYTDLNAEQRRYIEKVWRAYQSIVTGSTSTHPPKRSRQKPFWVSDKVSTLYIEIGFHLCMYEYHVDDGKAVLRREFIGMMYRVGN